MIINKENISNLPEIIITAPKISVLEAYDVNPELIEDPNVGILYYPLPVALEPIIKEVAKDRAGILPHQIYIKSNYDLNHRYYEFSIWFEKELELKSAVLTDIFSYLGARRIKIFLVGMIIDNKNLEEKIEQSLNSTLEGKVKIKNSDIGIKSEFDYKLNESNINEFYEKIMKLINVDEKGKYKKDFLKAKELAIKTGIWDDALISSLIERIIDRAEELESINHEVNYYYEIKGRIERVYNLLSYGNISGGIVLGSYGINLLLGRRYKSYEYKCVKFHSITEIKTCLEIEF